MRVLSERGANAERENMKVLLAVAAPGIGASCAATASVLNQKFASSPRFDHAVAGALYKQKRSIDLRMSSADFVHLKGLGSLLCLSMNEAMSARSAVTLR